MRPFSNKLGVENDTIKLNIGFTPIYSTTEFNSKRPYGWGNGLMIPNVGLQQYFSGGVYVKHKFFEIQLQPEMVFAQNRQFDGVSEDLNDDLIRFRFRDWNFGDFPERFGDVAYSNFWWGQSKFVFKLGSYELGASTQNIWWGPGQWNSLLFSNNAQGFPHITLNTHKPAKTFLGNFETQILIGRLESSNLPPIQNDDWNQRFFKPLSSDWRYLNALLISYNPKWIPNLFVGLGRTFQVYNQSRGNNFDDWLPIFEAFQKERFFVDGNSVEFDANDRDQQVSVFARYVVPKAKAEMYFEFGRRDHALNWREFILNPEHARAYLFGFKKLFDLTDQKLIQVRGEITHQQESVNRFIRYRGLTGFHSWHMHDTQRGFTNFGQPIGVGLGPGSNVQTIEVALVEKFDKLGLLFERLENNQGFFYRAFGQQNEHRPWIDLSVGLLYDKQWDNLLLSSRVQLINGMNYQWQLHPDSTPEFPRGQNLFSVHSQVSLIYLFNKK
ncbi:capsule assembly Wzi family protein [Mongoliitalea daihaiensis]|uniref:capsule assembly Wzi family protein n=1 Tax=Mongoliitalea daihaiensis TaxID=2782006 RepID=UPI001F2F85FB|nr:capsule assembly Wzi family protein [Mongoliitalea daihaiensis]